MNHSILRLTVAAASAFGIFGISMASPVAFQNGTATYSQTFDGGYPPSETIDGIFTAGNGWAIFNQAGGTSAQTIVWETTTDLTAAGLSFDMFFNHGSQHLLGRFRFSVTTDDRSLFADGLGEGGDVTANWTVMTPASVTATTGLTSTILGDGSVRMGGTVPAVGSYTVNFFENFVGVTGVRLEAMEDALLPTSGPGLQPSNGNFVLTEIVATSNPVPEPATLAILGLGALFLRRRRS
mgnify:CR=1 FL=1